MLSTKFNLIFYTIFVTILIILPFGESQTQINSFSNYPLIRVIPLTKFDLKVLKDFEGVADNNYIFLNQVNFINENVDILIAPHRVAKFKNFLKQYQITSTIISTNFQSTIGNEILQNGQSGAFSYNYFFNLNKIYEKLNALEKQYPQLVHQIVIGKTKDGTDLRVIKISNQTNKTEIKKKSGIFIEGGTHARSWISPATVVFIMEKLLTSKDFVIQSLINNFDWYFMPILNPDGYKYTEVESIWNKNRSPQKNYCNGVDLNRNWDLNWQQSTTQSTFKSCLENYPGLYPFSEIETKLLSNFLIDLKKNNSLHLYLSFQSGKQQFLYPYGSKKEKTKNDEDLETIAEVVVKALVQRRGTRYTYGSIFNSKYPIYGTSIDWVYEALGIPLSFRWELPNGDPTLRDARQIMPIGEETFDSVVALIGKAQAMGYFGKI